MPRTIPSLLLVDDDHSFCEVMERALERRGFAVSCAHSAEEALPMLQTHRPEYAVFDLKLPGASGLVLVEMLHRIKPEARVVVLSGYASVATAVDAVRLGAVHFLSKPANADEVVAAFSYSPSPENKPLMSQASSDQQEAEYLKRVLHEQHGNISQTARVLKMHRRTLQRKLSRCQS
ncbi:MAG: response regulator [Gallionellaceae bacterium]|nr:MAG: response regulator [Gallionellaceae bacterium]